MQQRGGGRSRPAHGAPAIDDNDRQAGIGQLLGRERAADAGANDAPRSPQTTGESLRSSRDDTTRVDAGLGDVEPLSAFALFDDGDDAALRGANDAREAALYPDGLLHWKRIFTAAPFFSLAL